MKKAFLLSLVLLFSLSPLTAQESISLAGEWAVQLDILSDTTSTNIDKNDFNDSGVIQLPGSLAEKHFGYKTIGSDFGMLTPTYKFIGKATYSKEIEIPKAWEDCEIEIIFERVLWQSTLFVDGIKKSTADALGSPHIHSLGRLKAGKHRIDVVINNDMIYNIGDRGHAYGPHTQTIWNGIVGEMKIQPRGPISIVQAKVFTDIHSNTITVKSIIQSEKKANAQIQYEVLSLDGSKILLSGNFKQKLHATNNDIEFSFDTKGKLERWSEFNPTVYRLKISLEKAAFAHPQDIEFGFYEVSKSKDKVLINGRPTFLRGNLDNVHFPLTGYTSCDLDDWLEIFKIYQQYGLNHARFHSWCPPEAAFKAANRLGIYLQVEASVWIDSWMNVNMLERGRPEMDTKGHPKGIGQNPRREAFIQSEMNRVVDTYGNHPSFIMFCIGNELGSADFSVLESWIGELKNKDPRKLYAASTARTITKTDDYSVTHQLQGIGWTRGLNGATTNWSFEDNYSKAAVPILAHEIGQWPVYPKWDEINKYTGVLKARNLIAFKEQAAQNGIVDQDVDFANASGALNQLLYKYEIESFLRTPSCAGIQLLSMQDYPGQGEAFVGWLDATWESKGITSPKQLRRYINTVVPLLLMDKYVWENDELFSAKIQLSNFDKNNIDSKVRFTISDLSGKIYFNKEFKKTSYKQGTLSDIGTVEFDLSDIEEATQLKLEVQLDQSSFKNDWSIWVYPKEVPNQIASKDIKLVDELDLQTLDELKSGATILLDAHKLGSDLTSVKDSFYPLYWSLTYFPGQGKTNIGLLVKDQHPAFEIFPTSSHSDWQWESISSDARAFILNDLPASYKPIAQPIDDFHRNNKVGSIFELKVGKGKLLVSGYHLNSDKAVARQLKSSLLKYVSSKDFQPELEVKQEWLIHTFDLGASLKEQHTTQELSDTLVFIVASAKLPDSDKGNDWNKSYDHQVLAAGFDYQVKTKSTVNGWEGKATEVQINCPDGILGTIRIKIKANDRFKDQSLIEFEGRNYSINEDVDGEKWIICHISREDSTDGKLLLKTKTDVSEKVIIEEILIEKE